MPFGSRWILPEKKIACLGDALLTCLVRYEVEGYHITPVILPNAKPLYSSFHRISSQSDYVLQLLRRCWLHRNNLISFSDG